MTANIKIIVDDNEAVLMNPYMNGLCEKDIYLTKGTHKYVVMNGATEVCQQNVTIDYDRDIYVRYFIFDKFNDNKSRVIDSVNNYNEFIHCATLVGDMEKFSNIYLSEHIDNWNPHNEFANFNYIGGGLFYKRIKIKKTLLAPYLLRYKIAFNNGWDNSLGFSDGSDLLIEIPAGTTEFIICVDSINRRVKDSINCSKTVLKLGNQSFRENWAFYTNISLCGNFNNFSCNDENYKFHQISKNIYVLYRYFEPGEYSYTCCFGDDISSQEEKKFSILEKTAVVFVYNLQNEGILVDSINDKDLVATYIGYRLAMPSKKLDKFAYNGNDLGATYTKEKTTFKVWAPSACRVRLKRYATGSDDEDGARNLGFVDMKLSKDNVWIIVFYGDLKNTYYNYSITIGDETFETVDIYAKAVGVNGERSMVVDLDSTNPDNWSNDKRVICEHQTDAIIWEVNIKDFSFLESSGVSYDNRGKYLAFTEKNTSLNNEGKYKTCLAHLKDLGITHVHLMPCFDFATIDEYSTDHESFNWGYDPLNYNVPEGSFSSNPFKGEVRINEFKRMVQSLHEENIGVVMDVVYNHTYETESSYFNLTVPKYYYRQYNGNFGNASGCGNEIASERAMVRKYITDSIIYWATEYHIDGFRFDLMGILDVDTLNYIRAELDKLPNGKQILMYGEPWSALPPSPDKPSTPMCSKNNTPLLNDRIAVFNDNFRDAIAGEIQHDVKYTGFVEGTNGHNESIKNGVLSQNVKLGNDRYVYWSKAPTQTVNYVSSHDNFTLYDKLVLATKGGNGYNYRYDDIIAMNKLAAALVITSQGIPFFQAGEEFARTKLGNSNSYNSPASANALDWNRVRDYSDLVEYYKGIIAIRKHYKAFRSPSCDILNSIDFYKKSGDNICAYIIKAYNKEIGIAINPNFYDATIELKELKEQHSIEKINIIANIDKSGLDTIDTVDTDNLTIYARNAIVFELSREDE